MTLNNRNPLEKLSMLLLLFMVGWLLFGCGGSKVKLSSREQLKTASQKFEALVQHNQSDAWQTIEVSKIGGKIVFRPLDPHKPMLTPNPNGGLTKTQNAVLEYSQIKSETKSNSSSKKRLHKVDHSKEKNTSELDAKYKDVKRENIGRATIFIVIGLLTAIVGGIIFLKRKTSISNVVQKWIGQFFK